MKYKLTPLSKVRDDQEYWKEARFRQYEIGVNVENKEDDFYEYLLVEIPGERNYVLLACVEGYKSGSALAFVKTAKDKNKFVVTDKAIKYSMGI